MLLPVSVGRFTAQITITSHGELHRPGSPAKALLPKLVTIGAAQAIAAPAPTRFSNVRREMPCSVSTESISTPFLEAQKVRAESD